MNARAEGPSSQKNNGQNRYWRHGERKDISDTRDLKHEKQQLPEKPACDRDRLLLCRCISRWCCTFEMSFQAGCAIRGRASAVRCANSGVHEHYVRHSSSATFVHHLCKSVPWVMPIGNRLSSARL